MSIRSFQLALLFCTFFTLIGCGATVRTAAYDPYRNETFRGTLYMSFIDGTGSVDVAGQRSGVKAHGVAQYKFGTTERRGGTVKLTTSDGRIINGEWVSTGLTTGTGVGYDQFGHYYTMVFGLNVREESAWIKQQKENRHRLLAMAKGGAMDVSDAPEVSRLAKPNRREETNKKATTKDTLAMGTGFFVSPRGYFMTCYHIIEDAEEIILLLPKRDEPLPARVIAVDPSNDAALLKVDAETAFLPIRTGSVIQAGARVATVGFPFVAIQGTEAKATFGHVNSRSGIGGDVRFLQIDVPIQPGNSGGPLIDRSGRVVGMVSSRLNALAIVEATGAMPENVNYTLKVGYLMPLCVNMAFESDQASPLTNVELVSRVRKAVALVVAN